VNVVEHQYEWSGLGKMLEQRPYRAVAAVTLVLQRLSTGRLRMQRR